MPEEYKTRNINLDHSSLLPREAEFLIGKVITGIKGERHKLTLILSDGSRLVCEGFSWDDGPLETHLENVKGSLPQKKDQETDG